MLTVKLEIEHNDRIVSHVFNNLICLPMDGKTDEIMKKGGSPKENNISEGKQYVFEKLTNHILISIEMQEGYYDVYAGKFLHIFVGNYMEERILTKGIVSKKGNLSVEEVIVLYNSLRDSKPYQWVNRDKCVFCRYTKQIKNDDVLIEIKIAKPKDFARCVSWYEFEELSKFKSREKVKISELFNVENGSRTVYLTDKQDFESVKTAYEASRHYALLDFPYGYLTFSTNEFEKLRFEIMSPNPGIVKEDFLMPGGGLEYVTTIYKEDSIEVKNPVVKKFDDGEKDSYKMEIKEFCGGFQTNLDGTIVSARKPFLDGKNSVNADNAFFDIYNLKVSYKNSFVEYSNIVYSAKNSSDESSYDLYLILKKSLSKAIDLSESDRKRFLKSNAMKFLTVEISKDNTTTPSK